MNKRILSLCLALALLLCLLPAAPTAAAAGDVAINETNFPDENFRSYVSENCDPDGDGLLSPTEISDVTEIECYYCGISSLKGIEYFTALEYLYCYDNQLTSLDVSRNTELNGLDCSENQLTSLDVSGNTALESLSCSCNQLTSLDMSGCTALKYLYCYDNQLTSLDVSGCTALGALSCYGNALTVLDVSAVPYLLDALVNGNWTVEDRHVVYKSDEGHLEMDLNQKTVPETSIIINEIDFPDEDFRRYVSENCDTDGDGLLSPTEISDVTVIECYECGISSLKGIEYFTALEYLYCYNNQLTSLDVSGCTALTDLRCSFNQLTSLDVSKNAALETLHCGGNQLTSLDVSKNTSLTELDCSENQLTLLDVSKNTALETLSCFNNQLTSLDLSKNTALTELDCGDNQLTSLDVSKNTALETLSCYYNQLTSLDLSKNTALTELDCGDNQLTSLDVSKNTALETLYCYWNQLTALGVSKNTALKELWCYDNQLTSLDVSGCTALESLYCYDNQLTSLDVSKNTALKELWCYNNQLSALDVSGCTALEWLDCGGNQLTSLDVSKNTALETLDCYDNQLTSLDVSKNTALVGLYCHDNQLTSLDVSKNTALVGLDCYNNQLTALDVSKNQELRFLACYGNKLAVLDVSAVPRLSDALENGEKTVEDEFVQYISEQGCILMDHDQNTILTPPAVSVKVTWKIGSSSITTEVPVGTVPVYQGETPSKSSTATSHYIFAGWKSGNTTYKPANLPKVTGDTTFTAVFQAVDHSFTARITSKPTCTQGGVKTFTCACGYSYTEKVAALGHDYVEGVCSRCGKKESAQNPFGDVKEKDYFYAPVMWAVSHEPQITAGTSKTKFSPSDDCTRAQVVTFLWRAAGAPEPKTTTNPFQDVREKDYFYKAVLWAVENGITSGTSKTRFSPNESCTRAQVVTFLWRYEKQKAPKSAANPFKDVKGNAYYYKAVLWAVENGVTSGTSKTKFSPDDTCTRGQIVTFLYRDLAGK